MSTGRWKLGLALTLVTVSMWSVLPLFLQAALKFVSPLNLNFMRFTGAGLVLALILGLRGNLPKPRQFKSNSIWPFLSLAVLGLAGNYAFYLWGVGRVSAAAAQVVIQLAPTMLTMGSILFFKERFSPRQFAGFLTLIAGLLFFFNHRWVALASALDEYAWGLVLIVIAALSWVVYALAQKRLLGRFGSPQLMVIIYLCGGALFAPFADFSELVGLSSGQWFVFAWCVLNTLVAYGAFAEAMSVWDTSRVSAILTLVPLGTIAAAAIAQWTWPGNFLYEPINWLSFLGALAVVGGSLTVALTRRVQ